APARGHRQGRGPRGFADEIQHLQPGALAAGGDAHGGRKLRRPHAPARHLTMRRNPKIKALANRSPLRKSALSATAAVRHGFPAWIDASDGAAFPAVMPRIRDALVLRIVDRKTSANPRTLPHGPGAR